MASDVDFDALEEALAEAVAPAARTGAMGGSMAERPDRDLPTEQDREEMDRVTSAAPPMVRSWVAAVASSSQVEFVAALFGWEATLRKLAEAVRNDPRVMGFMSAERAATGAGQLMAFQAAAIFDVMADCTARRNQGGSR